MKEDNIKSTESHKTIENVAVTDTPEFRLFHDAVIRPKWMERIHDVIENEFQLDEYDDPSKPYTCGLTDEHAGDLREDRAREIYGKCFSCLVWQRVAEELGDGYELDEDDPDDSFCEIVCQVKDELEDLPTTDYRYWRMVGGCGYLSPVYREVLQDVMPAYGWKLVNQRGEEGKGHTTIVGFRPPYGEPVIFDVEIGDSIKALEAAGQHQMFVHKMLKLSLWGGNQENAKEAV